MAFPIEWNYKCKFDINPTADTISGNTATGYSVGITQSATDFPNIFSGEQKCRINAGDIRFTFDESGTTELVIEVDHHDQDTSACVYWVKLPSETDLIGNTISVWMWWGVNDTWQPEKSASDGFEKVWDDNSLVLHMENDAPFHNESFDSTSGNAHFDASELETSDLAVDCILGRCLFFGGGDDELELNPVQDYDIIDTSLGTISFWANPTDLNNDTNPKYFSMRDSSNRFEFFYRQDANTMRFRYGDGTDYIEMDAISENDWSFITLTWDSTNGNVSMYLNGGLETSANVGSWTPQTITGRFKIAQEDNNTSFSYEGYLDDFRISKRLKNQSEIYLEYHNIINQSSFVSAGSVENIGLTFPNDWTKKAIMNIDENSVSGTHDGFPVLLKSVQVTSNMWTQIQDDAGDLRFTCDENGSSAIPIEVVRWDNTTSSAEVWIKKEIDDVIGANLYIWWLPSKIQKQPVEDTENGQFKVWDNFFQLVHHMKYKNDYDTIAVTKFVDSTSARNNSITDGGINGDLPTSADGQIGTAQVFDGDGDYIQIPDDGSINMGTEIVFCEALFKTPTSWPTAEKGKMEIFMKRTLSPWHNYEMQINNNQNPQDNHLYVYVQNTTNSPSPIKSNDALELNTIYYAVMKRVQPSGEISMYLNGVLQNETATETANIDNTADFLIGRDGNAGDDEWYEGEIDEIRVHKGIDRGDDWVWTMSNQLLNDDVYTITEIEISGGNVGEGNIDLPEIQVDGEVVLYNPDLPQNTIDELLVGEPDVGSWAYDLAKNALRTGEVFDEDAVNLSIENILSTLRGERIFNPEFGTILPLLIFEQLSVENAQQLLSTLLRAIKRFEKRVTVIDNEVRMNILTEENAFTLEIPYRIDRTGLIHTFAKKVIL